MRITASKTGLLEKCQYWAKDGVEWADITSDAADRGTRFHRAIANYIATGKNNPEDWEEDIRGLMKSAIAWVDSKGRASLRAEVAYAWDPLTDTAEQIPAVERDYQSGHGRLCGTADVVSIERDKRGGHIADWKTGFGGKSTAQLRTLALMLSRAEGLDTVLIGALEVTETGVRSVCVEVMGPFELAAHAGELAANIASISVAEPQPGPHCSEYYCPARVNCPAVQERISDIIPAGSLVKHKWGITIENADHAAWLYNQAKAVESAAKLVKDAVKAYVPESGIQLADGSRLIEGTRQMERFDRNRAVSLLRDKGATDEEIESCSRSVTESSGLRVSPPGKLRRLQAR